MRGVDWFMAVVTMLLVGVISAVLPDELIIGPISGCLCFACLRRYPAIIDWIHSKGFTIEDVKIIDDSLAAEDIAMITSQLNTTLTIMSAAAVGGVVDYGVLKWNHSSLSTIEGLGVVGGLVSLFRRVHVLLGKIVIWMFLVIRKKRARKYSDDFIAEQHASCPEDVTTQR